MHECVQAYVSVENTLFPYARTAAFLCFLTVVTVSIQGPVSERRLRENSEYVNPELRETLGFPFQNGRFVKPEKSG